MDKDSFLYDLERNATSSAIAEMENCGVKTTQVDRDFIWSAIHMLMSTIERQRWLKERCKE